MSDVSDDIEFSKKKKSTKRATTTKKPVAKRKAKEITSDKEDHSDSSTSTKQVQSERKKVVVKVKEGKKEEMDDDIIQEKKGEDVIEEPIEEKKEIVKTRKKKPVLKIEEENEDEADDLLNTSISNGNHHDLMDYDNFGNNGFDIQSSSKFEKISKKIYVCLDHDTMYPLAPCSLIVANDLKHARKLLDNKLSEAGFKTFAYKQYTLNEVNQDQDIAMILNDGAIE